ncbi:MAG: DUF2092 domain-containing protein [Chthoniobacter sp.]|nr:DUF2092 domain-containing protein [Chthoniobacter sp.]
MRTIPTLAVVSLALMALCTSPATAAVPKSAAENPDADQILRQMSDRLAGARSFRFEATRKLDPGLMEGQALPAQAHIVASVQRPNKIGGRAESKSGARRFVFDGRTVSLLDEKKNTYATVPMHTSLDGLVDQLDKKYGFIPPLAEFALSNPYAEFHRQAYAITYLGRDKVAAGFLGLGGVECHHLGLKGKEADAELWIAVGDQLPRKLVATFHRAGNPQLHIEFSTWNLAATVTAADFTFTPPKGAQKIEMWTTAKMQAASKH